MTASHALSQLSYGPGRVAEPDTRTCERRAPFLAYFRVERRIQADRLNQVSPKPYAFLPLPILVFGLLVVVVLEIAVIVVKVVVGGRIRSAEGRTVRADRAEVSRLHRVRPIS